MTSKQRAYLRALANPLETLLHVGKQGVTPEFITSVNEALEARELIKVGILSNCDIPPKEAADMLAGRARAECVQIIGKRIVLYKRSKLKPVIELP